VCVCVCDGGVMVAVKGWDGLSVRTS
jgi:hypothetical protein